MDASAFVFLSHFHEGKHLAWAIMEDFLIPKQQIRLIANDFQNDIYSMAILFNALIRIHSGHFNQMTLCYLIRQ